MTRRNRSDEKREDDERLWNLIIFKMYVTNKELEEAGPTMVVTAIVAVLLLVGIAWFKS